jgi:RNA ligase (TIGR02306 family)
MQLTKIVKIANLSPIEGADRIEKATVLGWFVVVQKGLHKVGDTVLFVFPDTLIPKKFIDSEYTGDEKVRLRTIKLRGQFSAGLILPLSDLPVESVDENVDYADVLGIEKYDPPMPAQTAGKVIGSFPTFLVSKTDEPNYRSNPEAIEELKEDRFKNAQFVATLKVDGTSATYVLQQQTMHKAFRVCSRNWELEEDEENTHWKIARKYDIENKLRHIGRDLSVQGEIFGESLNKNPLKIKGQQFNVFLIKDLLRDCWCSWQETVEICNMLDIPTVPVLATYDLSNLPSFAELQEMANKLTYPFGGAAEGMVLRTTEPMPSYALAKSWWSVKIISEPYDAKK